MVHRVVGYGNFIFTKKILEGESISVFNNGQMKRDFTYIDDIVTGIKSSLKCNYQNKIFNLGNSVCVDLMGVIQLIENKLKMKARIEYKKMQLGDVKKTFSDISCSQKKLDYNPKTLIKDGIDSFINWYKIYTANNFPFKITATNKYFNIMVVNGSCYC